MNSPPGTKPIKQCKGCQLNLKTNCAIFHHPELKWKGRNCEGYNNAMYIRHYENTLKLEGGMARKQARAAKARQKKTTGQTKRRAGRMA